MRLVAENLGMERGGRVLFARLNFALEPGTLTRLSGPNGAGKTSLLRLIAGLGEKSTGRLRLEGGDADLHPGAQAHFIAHQEAIKPALTARENLSFWSRFYGGGDVDAALAAFGLTALADDPAAWCSQGQRRRLALARLALGNRPLWLLDEPTVGLDSASEGRLAEVIGGHLQAGGIVLAASHVSMRPKPDQEIRLGVQHA